MTVETIDVSDVKQYLPAPYRDANAHDLKVPIITDATRGLFLKYQPKELSLSQYNTRIITLKSIVSEIKKYEKVETLHKCLSIIAIAATVAVVAALILLPVPLIAIRFATGFGMGFGMVGSILLESFRTATHPLRYSQAVLAFLIGALSFGLSTPVHYAVGAFSKKANLDKQLNEQQSKVERDFTVIREFLQKNGAEIEAKIQANLTELKVDGPKKEEQRSEPYQNLAEDCELLIKEHEHALIELAAVRAFYLV